MRLFELFTKVADWEWNYHNSEYGIATFKIEDYYTVKIEEEAIRYYLTDPGAKRSSEFFDLAKRIEENDEPLYAIEFDISNEEDSASDSDKLSDPYGITGTGNQFLVFTTVMDIMNDYKRSYNVDWWVFSATESSRQKLYSRMAKRFSGEYVSYTSSIDGGIVYLVKA